VLSIRAAVNEFAFASGAYPVSQPRPQYVEQDAADYLRVAREVCRQLMAGTQTSVQAVGFSTQTPTLVLLDEALQPVAPAIVWQDSRAGAQAAELAQVDDVTRLGWFGMEIPTGAATTPAKLLWLRDRDPETWARARWGGAAEGLRRRCVNRGTCHGRVVR